MKKLILLFFLTLFSLGPGFSVGQDLPMSHWAEPTQQVVYITKTGTKYHKGSCHHLRNSKIKTTKSEAQKAGYTACKTCKP